MADRSAAAITAAMLADDPCAAVPALVDAVAADPPLARWIAVAGRCEGAVLTTAAEAAEWCAPRTRRLFAAGTTAEEDCPASFVDRVGIQLENALFASHLAGADHRAAAEARWVGLLDDPCRLDELGGRKASLSAQVQKRIHREAEELVQRWRESLPGVGGQIAMLAEKLARLERLESQFAEHLEHEKLEALAEFAAGAGHEINNPLATIAGRAQLLLRDEASPDRRRDLATINAQARRAHEMIADMRLFARPPRPEAKHLDLARLAAEVLAEVRPAAEEREIDLTQSGARGPVEAEADPVQLRVVLHALLRNAMEAIGQRGTIEVQLAATDDSVEFVVADDGPGIAPEHRRHLFDPFYSSRQAGRGLGMGLAKCRRIVTQHGGTIVAENGSARGAVLRVVLPRRFGGESDA